MKATVLTLDWPENLDMQKIAFETEARSRRYQALGKACRDHGISLLIVAHHSDDQAETVMMRLAYNRIRTGLCAMQRVEWIPECEGIHGVHHSGDMPLMPNMFPNLPLPIEQGGIRVVRPLLGFDKSRLIATCQGLNIPWAEDGTNKVQTLTPRNAIRHIYQNHTLPEALSVKSLVRASLHMQTRINHCHSHAKRLFDECLIKLDVQLGSLLIRFPPFSSLLDRPIISESDLNEASNNACLLIERVAALVAPQSDMKMGQIAGKLGLIYPEFLRPEQKQAIVIEKREEVLPSFTVLHTWWRQRNEVSLFKTDASSKQREWLIVRRAPDHHERKDPLKQIIVKPSQEFLGPSKAQKEETYHLFDGRFWIKIFNHTNDTLIIRLFQKRDKHHLPNKQDDKKGTVDALNKRYLTAALSFINFEDVLFSLPAVFRRDSITGSESLVGFPTLDVSVTGPGAPQNVCEWTVRYKKLDLGAHPVGDIVSPGITRGDLLIRVGCRTLSHMTIMRLVSEWRHGYVHGRGPQIQYKLRDGQWFERRLGEDSTEMVRIESNWLLAELEWRKMAGDDLGLLNEEMHRVIKQMKGNQRG